MAVKKPFLPRKPAPKVAGGVKQPTAKPALKPHSKNNPKKAAVLDKAPPTATRRPVRFSRGTTARRAIIRAQKASSQTSVIKARPFTRLVLDALPWAGVASNLYRLQQGFIRGMRDVTENWMNEATKSARRLAQEQVPPAQTVMGRTVQSAVHRWCMADPRMNSIFYSYKKERENMGLPPLAIPTDDSENELSKKVPAVYDDDVETAAQVLSQGMKEERAEIAAASRTNLASSATQSSSVGAGGVSAAATGNGGSTSSAIASSAKPRSAGPSISARGSEGKAATKRSKTESNGTDAANVVGAAQEAEQDATGVEDAGAQGQGDLTDDTEQGLSTDAHPDNDERMPDTEENAASDAADDAEASDADLASDESADDGSSAAGPMIDNNLSDADMP
jgi:hypothetical protein